MRRPYCLAAIAATIVLAGCGAGAHQARNGRHPPSPTPASTPQSAMGTVAPPGWGRPAPPSTPQSVTAPAATATMYDSIEVSTIPRSPFAAAGYTGGHWRTFPQLRRSYPQTHTVSIAVFPSEHAACADIEPGDLTPAQAPGWVRADERAGYRKPCLYSDWSEWVNELAPALKRAGIALASVFKWVASFVSRPTLIAGFDADQWTDHCLGRNLDCSLVLRSFLQVAEPPVRPPVPVKQSLRLLDELLGAHTRRNPHGRNCQHPPYRHAYPSARYDHACLIWAREVAALR